MSAWLGKGGKLNVCTDLRLMYCNACIASVKSSSLDTWLSLAWRVVSCVREATPPRDWRWLEACTQQVKVLG